MNSYLSKLQPYPFEKLAALKKDAVAHQATKHIALSIGEPKHEPPTFVIKTLNKHLDKVSNYAATRGTETFRLSVSNWAQRRFHLNKINADENVLPLNGTREGIFSFTQALVDGRAENACVLMPNPFYQIYEGAAYLAGAKPIFLNCHEENDFLPDYKRISEQTWKDCQVLFLCSPGNPTGKVMAIEQLQALIALSDKYNFIIASDECYSELYFDVPPTGLLEACADMGRDDYKNCVVFHSLSKRSNLPGLRSGFIAGDAELIRNYLLYRTYHGCAMPLHVQEASIAAWSDEQHVALNRARYSEKFLRVLDCLDNTLHLKMPDAGFYLWPKTPINDEDFVKGLYKKENVTVLPGSYLSRETDDGNPGENRVRMALVATLGECIDAAERIKNFCHTL